MPKIEIELSEIESIRGAVKYWESRYNELEKQHEEFKKNVDVEKLAAKAKKFSIDLMNSYLNKVFNELGFNNSDYRYSVTFDTSMFYTIDQFVKSPITVTCCAEIVGQMKTAYLKVGVNTEAQEESKKDPLEL